MIPLKSLALICRNLCTVLDSGVPVDKSLELAAGKTGNRTAREALARTRESIRDGSTFEEALRSQGETFPILLIDMVGVAEDTGHLPEVLGKLADHYDNLLKMRKMFLTAITWPVIQLVAAVLVIALLIFVLGIVGDSQGGNAPDVLGWGLTGTSGAVTWLVSVGLVAAAGAGMYRAFRKSLKWRKLIDPYLLRIPGLGPCLRNFAIARFSWAFALTQQAGMSLAPSLRASLLATSNGAFIDAGQPIWNRLKAGEDFSTAIASCGLFPDDYIQMLVAAEAGGTVPEALDRLSPHFEQDAQRSLSFLVQILGWGIWLLVAAFIIAVIFSVALWYVGILNDAASFEI